MKILRDQIYELWKLKVAQYGKSKPGSIWGGALLSIVLLCMPLGSAQFSTLAIWYCILSSGAFLTVAITVYTRIKKIKVSRYRKKNSYPSVILLYALYDIGVRIMIFTAIFTSSIFMQQHYGITLFQTGALLALFIVVVIGSIFLSPWFVRRRLLRQFSNSYKHLPLAITVTRVLPPLGVLIAAILVRSQYKQAFPFIVSIMGFCVSMFLLPSLVFELYENIVLSLEKWPEIKRENSGFVVTYPLDEDTDVAS